MSQELKTLLMFYEYADYATAIHTKRVANLARQLALKLNLGPEFAEDCYEAGLCHDLGKIAIPLEILSKKQKIRKEELRLIMNHVTIGADIGQRLNLRPVVIDGILYHHERLDGSGYPSGLIGEKIPLIAQLVAVADCMEAMTADKPYRDNLGVHLALAELANPQKYNANIFVACRDLFTVDGYALTPAYEFEKEY